MPVEQINFWIAMILLSVGWHVWINRRSLTADWFAWLSHPFGSGQQGYLSWDAPLGLAGLGLSLRGWLRAGRRVKSELPVALGPAQALSPAFALASPDADGDIAALPAHGGGLDPPQASQPPKLEETATDPGPANQSPMLGETAMNPQPPMLEGAAMDLRPLATQDQPTTPGAHVQLSMDLEQGRRVRVTVEVLPPDGGQGDSPALISHTILVEGERVSIAVPLTPGETPYQLGQGSTLPAGARPHPGAWGPWIGARRRLATALQAWPHSLAATLFGLGLLVYLAIRLVGIADFPIYFFTDEAVQTNLAADMLANGWRDRFDEFLPTFFKNGRHYNLSLSVYVQAIPYLLFGKSVFVTRAVSVLITLLGALAVSLGLRKVFSLPYWWSGVLVLSITPAWFLHSRTAFETAMATALYAGFIYFYLLYRHQAPRYLYPAVVSAALSFYTYSPAQMVVALSAALLLVSDWRYHRENRRTILGGLALAAALALPYLRFYLVHPAENFRHLNALGSYWTQSLPLSEKLRHFLSLYAYGLNPLYWFVPNQHDLARHLMKGYGHILGPIFPFVMIGLSLALRRSFRHPHASAYRTLLIALLAAPSGGALAYIGITRVLFLVIPAAWLATLGLSACLAWLEKRWASRQVLSLGLFALLSLIHIGMARDALTNGPTWYREYGLQGMQYGARQTFAAIQDYWRVSPETRIVLSPSWTNGTEEVARFFLPDTAPLRLGSIEAHMFQRLPLDQDTLFVMIPEEYDGARESGKFKDIQVEKTIPYPDGRPGFYFARLDYVDQIDEILAAEREARRQLLEEQLVLDGQRVVVEYPLLDMGKIAHAFDGDPDTLIRTLEANPLILKLVFPSPRPLEGVTVRAGGAATGLTVRVASLDNPEELVFTGEVGVSSEYRNMTIEFGASIPAARLAIEVKNAQEGEPAHVHVWEISLH